LQPCPLPAIQCAQCPATTAQAADDSARQVRQLGCQTATATALSARRWQALLAEMQVPAASGASGRRRPRGARAHLPRRSERVRPWTCPSSGTLTARTSPSPAPPWCIPSRWLEQLHADPLPEILQGGRRSGVGHVLPFRYETFPHGTQVPTFKRRFDRRGICRLDQANRVLAVATSQRTANTWAKKLRSKSVTVRPGKTVAVQKLKGRLPLRASGEADLPRRRRSRRAARAGILIRWDGEKNRRSGRQLGDFFARPAPTTTVPCRWGTPR